MAENTREKASGRSQAAVKAQIAPEELPAMARSLPFFESRIARPSAVFFFLLLGRGIQKYCFFEICHLFLDRLCPLYYLLLVV